MIAVRLFTTVIITIVFAVYIASYLRQLQLNKYTRHIKQIIFYFSQIELSYRPSPQSKPGPHVLVGFGGCVDLNVRAITLFSSMNLSCQSLQHSSNLVELNTMDDVLKDFANAFVNGAAVERLIHNATLFDELVSLASKLTSTPTDNETTAWWSLGGNAPVMASRLSREGARVTLAARLSQRMQKHLPATIRVLTAPANFGLSVNPVEDVHLVLEYERGDQWGDLTAPRANRYILVHDKENSVLSSLWSDLLSTWQQTTSNLKSKLDLFVLGGLQLMDNLLPDKKSIRSSRIEELGSFLHNLSSTETLVHFEMASFMDQNFSNQLLDKILPYVDSIGANEQELPNLVSLLTNGTIVRISSAYPRAAAMLDSMRFVWAKLNDRQLPKLAIGSRPAWRRLSRLHIHTPAHQIIMVRRHARGGAWARAEFERTLQSGGLAVRRADFGLEWPFLQAAVAKASLVAHRHTCASSSIDPLRTKLLIDESFSVTDDAQRWRLIDSNAKTNAHRIYFNESSPISCWTEVEPRLDTAEEMHHTTVVRICIAPVLVCDRVKRTAGAGDNISASALYIQTVGS